MKCTSTPLFCHGGFVMDKWKSQRKYTAVCIRSLMDEYKPPSSYFSKNFYNYTDSIWALKELRNYILTNRNRSPISLIEEFIEKMDKASTMYHPAEAGYCFSVAKDTALYVYDALMMGSYMLK